MDDFPAIENDTPTSKGDSTSLLLELTIQEGTAEAAAPTRTSSWRFKASARALEIREQESLNLNKAFSAVQEEQ